MAKLVIKDLPANETMGSEALGAIWGRGAAGQFLFSFPIFDFGAAPSQPPVVNQFFEINQSFTEVTQFITLIDQTVNQNQINVVNVESINDSVIGIDVNQGQLATNS